MLRAMTSLPSPQTLGPPDYVEDPPGAGQSPRDSFVHHSKDESMRAKRLVLYVIAALGVLTWFVIEFRASHVSSFPPPSAESTTPVPFSIIQVQGRTFARWGCNGCHTTTNKTKVGPGLGGLFDDTGTAAYGTALPNGMHVTEANVREWIRGGTSGFPARHVNLNPEADNAEMLQNGMMPGFRLTDDEYHELLQFLQAFRQDGTVKPGYEVLPPPRNDGFDPSLRPKRTRLDQWLSRIRAWWR